MRQHENNVAPVDFAAVEEYIQWLRRSFESFGTEYLICKLRSFMETRPPDLLEHLCSMAYTLFYRGEGYRHAGSLRRNVFDEQGVRLCETICHICGVTDYITQRIEQALAQMPPKRDRLWLWEPEGESVFMFPSALSVDGGTVEYNGYFGYWAVKARQGRVVDRPHIAWPSLAEYIVPITKEYQELDEDI